MAFYSRKSPRMKCFDYSTPSSYFITICTHEKKRLFGKPNELNAWGQIAQEELFFISQVRPGIHLDHFVVMPNHIHMLMTIHFDEIPDRPFPNVSAIIGSYKAGVSRRIHLHSPGIPVWQRSFHDHVIRTKKAWQEIWQYIDENPAKWEMDCFYQE